jgi:hypothetical protein
VTNQSSSADNLVTNIRALGNFHIFHHSFEKNKSFEKINLADKLQQ